MITLSTRLIAILTQLRKAVLTFAHRQTHAQNPVWLGTIAYAPAGQANQPPPLPAETWELLTARLARMAARFAALFARWHAGTLPAPRPSRAGRPYTPKPIPRLPAGRGWINRRIAEAAPCGGMIEILLHDPELPAFLAAAPQAGRILRPLCRMLGLIAPDCLRLPPRPKPQPRPAAPKPPPDPEPLRRPLPAYVSFAVRAWKKYDR